MTCSNNLFEMLSSKREIKNDGHFSQKKLFIGQMRYLGEIAPNLCNFIFHDPLYQCV